MISGLANKRESTGGRAKTLHSIQVLRAVAALIVALFHGHQAFVNAGSIPGFSQESYLFSFGAVGVHIFFVISGFIMVHTTKVDGGFDVRAFMRRRLLRIYPIYWICAALYLVVNLALGDPYDLGLAEALGALVLLPGDAPKIIGPAWTLSFEMYFYICFGLFMMLGLTRGLMALVLFFLASMVMRPMMGWDQSALNLASNPLLLEFLAGCAIGWLSKRERLPSRGGWVVFGLSLILFGIGTMIGFDRVPSVIAWGLPSALLVCGLVMIENRQDASSFVRKIGRFGDSSYALYLIHILVITVALHLAEALGGARSLPPVMVAIVLAVLAQIVAELLHRGVEKPLLKRINPRRSLLPVRNAPVADQTG